MKNVVVSGAKSRSHLIYLASYLRILQAEGAEITVYFMGLQPFLHAQAVTVDDAREIFPDGIDIHEGLTGWSPQGETVYLCVGAPGVRTLRVLAQAMGVGITRLRIVVTDEGIGSYGDMRTAVAARRRQGGSLPNAIMKTLTGKVANLIPATRWATYLEPGWDLNQHVVDEFLLHTEEFADREKTAIILTQPFVDIGLIEEKAYLAYVVQLAQHARACGLRPYVRPHPAERPGRYDAFEVMNDRGTAELDPEVLRAAVCLGGPSTALVNLSAMRNMPVVWCSAPGLEFLDTNVSRAQREIFTRYLGVPLPVGSVESAIRKHGA